MNTQNFNTFNTGSFKTCPSADRQESYIWTLPNLPEGYLHYLNAPQSQNTPDHPFFTPLNFEFDVKQIPSGMEDSQAENTEPSSQECFCIPYFAPLSHGQQEPEYQSLPNE